VGSIGFRHRLRTGFRNVLVVQLRDKLLGRVRSGSGRGKFTANAFQFAMVQPVTTAAWTTVDLHLLFDAEKMLPQHHVPAARTPQSLRPIARDVRVPLHVRRDPALAFVPFVESLQFKMIKPNSAAAFVADIDQYLAYRQHG